MIWCVIWVVLMILWICGGGFFLYDANNRGPLIAGTVIPWLCVLIIGLIMFGAITVSPVSFR